LTSLPINSPDLESVHFIDRKEVQDLTNLIRAIERISQGIIVITTPDNLDPAKRERIVLDLQYNDIIHCGLLFNKFNAMDDLQAISLNWGFLSPDKAIKNSSWKATSHFFAFDVGLYHKMNGFAPMSTVDGALTEFAYRSFRSGADVMYDPSYWTETIESPEPNYSRGDVKTFCALHLGKASLFFLRVYYLFGIICLAGHKIGTEMRVHEWQKKARRRKQTMNLN
jgi:hypothetical protein